MRVQELYDFIKEHVNDTPEKKRDAGSSFLTMCASAFGFAPQSTASLKIVPINESSEGPFCKSCGSKLKASLEQTNEEKKVVFVLARKKTVCKNCGEKLTPEDAICFKNA